MTTKNEAQTKILFICLGNICRSPAAHAVFQKAIEERGLTHHYMVDSAGIGDWHVGQLPDKRMMAQGKKRGYCINHHARQFTNDDFQHFDYIVVMDDDNYRIVHRRAKNEEERKKVKRMADFFTVHKEANSVPDPYYGTTCDFDYALDLIEDGVKGILDKLG